jgi:RNA polymerase sigma factor (TIGR02999 family)
MSEQNAPVPPEPQRQITQLLRTWRAGDPRAMDELMPLIYQQLRSVASYYMRQERPDHTLRPTALVHEAYLKLSSADNDWQDRAHFLAIAAITMRRILVDHARTARRVKRGDGARRVDWEDALLVEQAANPELLDLDAALTRLSQQDSRKGRLIELLYFGGLTCEECAKILEVSTATVNRDLKLAKAWLLEELKS